MTSIVSKCVKYYISVIFNIGVLILQTKIQFYRYWNLVPKTINEPRHGPLFH